MAASQCQTANETRHKAGGDDECRKEHISIDGVGGGGEKTTGFAIGTDQVISPQEDYCVVYDQQGREKERK